MPDLKTLYEGLQRAFYSQPSDLKTAAALLAVLALGQVTHGSRITWTVAGITFQPSEFVKLLFVFFLVIVPHIFKIILVFFTISFIVSSNF